MPLTRQTSTEQRWQDVLSLLDMPLGDDKMTSAVSPGDQLIAAPGATTSSHYVATSVDIGNGFSLSNDTMNNFTSSMINMTESFTLPGVAVDMVVESVTFPDGVANVTESYTLPGSVEQNFSNAEVLLQNVSMAAPTIFLNLQQGMLLSVDLLQSSVDQTSLSIFLGPAG